MSKIFSSHNFLIIKRGYSTKKLIIEFIRIVLGIIFLITGFLKFIHIQEFADSIEKYQLIPHCFVFYTAIIISLIEVVIGISLIFNLLIKLGVLITSSLMMLFIIITSITLFNGLDIDCGCFIGIYHKKISVSSLIIQIMILSLSLILLRQYNQGFISNQNKN